jgi:hypothetical protein
MKIVAVISAAGAFANCALGRASRRRRVRTLTAPALGLVLCGLIGARLPATATATSFGVETFEAGTCNKSNCTYKSVEENHAEAYTQADGHPPYGLTGFKLNHTGEGTAELPVGALEGVRVDLPPGLSVNPLAIPRCPLKAFEETVGGNPNCPEDTISGTDKVTVAFEGEASFDVGPVELKIYNLEPPAGLPLEEGIYNGLAGERSYLEGHVSWHHEAGIGVKTGDYHEYFEIHKLPRTLGSTKTPILKIEQIFFGNKEGGFLRLPSECASTAISHIRIESYEGEIAEAFTHTPIGVEGCELAPFPAFFSFAPSTTVTDQPTGARVETAIEQKSSASEIDSSDLKEARVLLPEGLTLNPAAATGLEGCTPAQIGIEEDGERSENPVSCPQGSLIGTVSLETPTLPAGALKGNVYLGKPATGSITEPPYTIYLTAENVAQYGVAVRLKGKVTPNPVSGRLEATFSENPELPFSSLKIDFKEGPLAPLANPLTCGSATTSVTLTPFSGFPASFAPKVEPFTVSGCPAGGAPFAPPGLAQEATIIPSSAGSFNNFTLDLARAEGQQYLSTIRTVLPPGLVGDIPDVTPCPEAAANAGSCSIESKIGSVSVQAGSGSSPYTFNGTVYLTEKYAGAPYGLSIVVPANAGPFALGNVITRAKVEVEPYTAQVVVSASLPMIVKGIPIRLRAIHFHVDRQGFYRNPTSCAALPLLSSLGGTPTLPAVAGGGATLESKLQAQGCASLPFAPKFAASTSAKTSRLGGASLKVTIGQQGGGEANIAKAVTTQPYLLPSRLATLQKACPEAQGAANIMGCPESSLVGHVSAVTPTLPGTMEGPAYIVSQGGRAFPNLDLVLEGDGVRVILVGNTDIHKGITTTTFAANPDVPIKSFTLELPTGPHSLLSSNGSLCRKPLFMPTVLVGQNGKEIHQRTRIAVTGCLPILRHRLLARKRMVAITLRAPQAGRVILTGNDLKRRVARVRKARLLTVRVPLTRAGIAAIRHHHRTKVRVRVHFIPRLRGGAQFTSFAMVMVG